MSDDQDLDRLITLATDRSARAAASTTRWVLGVSALVVLLLGIALQQRRTLASQQGAVEPIISDVGGAPAVPDDFEVLLERLRQGERHAREGVELAGRGRLGEAIAAYSAALEYDPDNPGHYELRGYAYLRRYQINGRTDATDLENAIIDLERAVAVDSTYEWGYYNLGLAYWELGREEDTFATLGRLFTLNPRFRGVVAGDPQYQRIVAAEGFADLGS